MRTARIQERPLTRVEDDYGGEDQHTGYDVLDENGVLAFERNLSDAIAFAQGFLLDPDEQRCVIILELAAQDMDYPYESKEAFKRGLKARP